MGRFGRFGGTKNDTLGARIKIPRPLLEIQTTPKTPNYTPWEPFSALEKWFLAILSILHIFASFSECKKAKNFKWDAQYRLWVYKFENLRNALYWQNKQSLQRGKPKSKIFFCWHRLIFNLNPLPALEDLL